MINKIIYTKLYPNLLTYTFEIITPTVHKTKFKRFLQTNVRKLIRTMQNKRMYIKPILESETFVPQNYIAACGDTEYGDYYFECNAGDLGLWRYPYRVYTNSGQYLGKYHACGQKHIASSKDDFINGYMDDDRTDKFDNIKVIIWRGRRGDDIHCTTNLDQDSWETVKS